MRLRRGGEGANSIPIPRPPYSLRMSESPDSSCLCRAGRWHAGRWKAVGSKDGVAIVKRPEKISVDGGHGNRICICLLALPVTIIGLDRWRRRFASMVGFAASWSVRDHESGRWSGRKVLACDIHVGFDVESGQQLRRHTSDALYLTCPGPLVVTNRIQRPSLLHKWLTKWSIYNRPERACCACGCQVHASSSDSKKKKRGLIHPILVGGKVQYR